MNTMYDAQSILSFALESFAIASLSYFVWMFISQYPSYVKNKIDGNSQLNKPVLKELQTSLSSKQFSSETIQLRPCC